MLVELLGLVCNASPERGQTRFEVPCSSRPSREFCLASSASEVGFSHGSILHF